MDGRVSGSKGNNGANYGLMMVSETNNFNIASIVGAENVGKYSINDFIVCDNLSNDLTVELIATNQIKVTGISPTIKLVNDFELIYDNTTGDVEINNKIMTNSIFYKGLNAAGVENQYYTIDFTFSIPPKVYLLVKTGDGIVSSNLDIADKPKLISILYTYYEDENIISQYKELYKNGVITDTIYYDKNGNPITESEE